MRRRGFESHPVLFRSLTIEITTSAHDVAVAYCLAMADVRVRLPLGAPDSGRGKVWPLFLIRTGRVLRAHEIAGSNPAVLTDAVVLVLVRAVGCYPS